MKGFASYFFLLFLASMGVSQYAFSLTSASIATTTTYPIHALGFERTQLEHAMDAIIEEELVKGMQLHLPSEQIKTTINQALLQLLSHYIQENQSNSSITIQLGMGTLQTTDYFSLLDSSRIIPTIEILNANSHVLVLPLNSAQRYGEYTYTGGTHGSGIFIARIETTHAQTLAALPAGYRICASTATGALPCV